MSTKITIKHTFKNGTTMEGTISDVQRFAGLIGEPLPDYHFSNSTGRWMKISDMNDRHIRNAILALASKHLQQLNDESELLSNAEFIRDFTKMVNNEINKLFTELSKRV